MRELEGEIKEAGVTVRFVVIGTPAEATRFCGPLVDPSYCLADPERRTYQAMGFGAFDLRQLFANHALRRRRGENRAAGFRQNWRATKLHNAAQLPGAAFIDGDGIVRWIHRGEHPGDLPPISEMLAAAR